jgi:RHS repeat-associated protein
VGTLKLTYNQGEEALEKSSLFVVGALEKKSAAKKNRVSAYRYGFQGQEKDDEVKGNGNSINFKYRMHDPRIGRFFSVDPLAAMYPYNSPYAFSENRVIDGIELEGFEVLLIGGYSDASAVLSMTTEFGIIVAPDGIMGYYTSGGGLESNVSGGAGLSISFFPGMRSYRQAEGGTYSVGASGGEGVDFGFNLLAAGNDQFGINFKAGIGGGISPVAVGAMYTNTKLVPLSDEQKRGYKTKMEAASKIIQNDLDKKIDQRATIIDDFNNANESGDSDLAKELLGKFTEVNKQINQDKAVLETLNNAIEKIDD